MWTSVVLRMLLKGLKARVSHDHILHFSSLNALMAAEDRRAGLRQAAVRKTEVTVPVQQRLEAFGVFEETNN